jgi:uncharacterized RDD family membrane protein YckC
MSTPAIPAEQLPPRSEVLQPEREIAGFWRRLGAFALDMLLLAVAVHIVTFPFFSQLCRIGAWAPILGFFLVMPYYVLLNSRAANGQTLGKMMMHIQVVNESGGLVPVSATFLRYAVLYVPLFLSGLDLPVTRTPQAVQYLVFFLFGGMVLVTTYLLVCNRATRQGLHDMAAGTYVVRVEQPGAVRQTPVWTGHWVIIFLLTLSTVCGAWYFSKLLNKWVDMPALLEDLRAVERIPGVQSGAIVDQTSWSNGKRGTAYVVTANFTGDANQAEILANAIASEILVRDPHVLHRDRLVITIVRGYNLGFARASVSHPFYDTPSGWQERLDGKSIPDPSAE